jgi:hypothetical protein
MLACQALARAREGSAARAVRCAGCGRAAGAAACRGFAGQVGRCVPALSLSTCMMSFFTLTRCSCTRNARRGVLRLETKLDMLATWCPCPSTLLLTRFLELSTAALLQQALRKAAVKSHTADGKRDLHVELPLLFPPHHHTQHQSAVSDGFDGSCLQRATGNGRRSFFLSFLPSPLTAHEGIIHLRRRPENPLAPCAPPPLPKLPSVKSYVRPAQLLRMAAQTGLRQACAARGAAQAVLGAWLRVRDAFELAVAVALGQVGEALARARVAGVAEVCGAVAEPDGHAAAVPKAPRGQLRVTFVWV